MKDVLLGLLARLRILHVAFRGYEAVKSLRAGGGGVASDRLPLPPPRLIVRVAGTADAAWFLEGGRLAAGSIRAAVARHGAPVEELGAILDFGCGCGRVTRAWHDLPGRVCGSDRDVDAVAWCRDNLPFARFETNGLAPPLAFAAGELDLVYALSVLTHLTEGLQLAWVEELRRVLAPEGLLLFSTHGAAYRSRLDERERRRFDDGELVIRRPQVVGTNLCTTFHPERWVRERLLAGWQLLELVPEGAKGNPEQDLWLARRA